MCIFLVWFTKSFHFLDIVEYCYTLVLTQWSRGVGGLGLEVGSQSQPLISKDNFLLFSSLLFLELLLSQTITQF